MLAFAFGFTGCGIACRVDNYSKKIGIHVNTSVSCGSGHEPQERLLLKSIQELLCLIPNSAATRSSHCASVRSPATPCPLSSRLQPSQRLPRRWQRRQPSPARPSRQVGIYVFPSKNQTASQQSTDEGACFGWAKSQTGIDPMNISAEPTPASAGSQASQAQSSSAGSGAAARGAVGGAAAGAAIGAVAGNAGKGAAIGATTGVLAGGAAKRRAQQDAAAQQQQQQAAAAQQAQAAVAQRKATYNKAFSACMEGKGYTVK